MDGTNAEIQASLLIMAEVKVLQTWYQTGIMVKCLNLRTPSLHDIKKAYCPLISMKITKAFSINSVELWQNQLSDDEFFGKTKM